jgi:hypothetical protein
MPSTSRAIVAKLCLCAAHVADKIISINVANKLSAVFFVPPEANVRALEGLQDRSIPVGESHVSSLS